MTIRPTCTWAACHPVMAEGPLRALFEPVGLVVDVKVITDRATGLSRGFGFVRMADIASAEAAVAALNGYMVGGKRLTVRRRGQNASGAGAPAGAYPAGPPMMGMEDPQAYSYGSDMYGPYAGYGPDAYSGMYTYDPYMGMPGVVPPGVVLPGVVPPGVVPPAAVAAPISAAAASPGSVPPAQAPAAAPEDDEDKPPGVDEEEEQPPGVQPDKEDEAPSSGLAVQIGGSTAGPDESAPVRIPSPPEGAPGAASFSLATTSVVESAALLGAMPVLPYSIPVPATPLVPTAGVTEQLTPEPGVPGVDEEPAPPGGHPARFPRYRPC
eukprot:jgi/Botrbrau1/22335/Bobra.0002s0014.1